MGKAGGVAGTVQAGRLLVAGVLLLGAGAQAATLDADLRLTHDSDSFASRAQTLGWTSSGGFGLEAGALRYDAPGWRADGHRLAAAWRHRGERLQLELEAGVLELGDFTHRVASLELMQRLGEDSAIGLSAERAPVDSVLGIAQGLHATHLLLVGDHRFGPRLAVGVAAGASRFSDGNTRPLLRTRWTWALHEGRGLHLVLRTRSYRNSDPGRPQYYSPERLHELSLGLSARFALADAVVVSAQADAGRQRTEAAGPAATASKPLWSYSLGLSSPRSARVSWRIALQASNAASSSPSSGDGYRHAGLTAQLSLPF